MNTSIKIKKYIALFKIMTILTIIEFIMLNSNWLCRDKILRIICLIVFMIYFIKEFMRIKWDLIRQDTMQTFAIEIVGNLLLLVNILIFIKINKFNDSNNLVIYACIFWIALFLIKFIQFIKSIVHQDREKFFFFIAIFIALSSFSKNTQEIITIVTTLITAIFGRIVLKNIFANEIEEHKKKCTMSEGATLDRLEYRIAMANIQLIVHQL